MEINVLLALMVILSFLIAIPLHEFGHALMASWLGDQTPRSEGRLSLSWRTHIDPLGTIMCVVMAFQPVLAVGLGWGKPVKPDPWKMCVGPNAGLLIVAVAGPVFSLLIGLVVAVLIRFLPPALFESVLALRVPQFLIVFASVNIGLTTAQHYSVISSRRLSDSLYALAKPTGGAVCQVRGVWAAAHPGPLLPVAVPGAVFRSQHFPTVPVTLLFLVGYDEYYQRGVWSNPSFN